MSSSRHRDYVPLDDEPSSSGQQSQFEYTRDSYRDYKLRMRPEAGTLERLRTRGSSRGATSGGNTVSYGGVMPEMQVPLLAPGASRGLPIGVLPPQIVTHTSSSTGAPPANLKRQSSAGNKAIMAMLAPQVSVCHQPCACNPQRAATVRMFGRV